MEKASGANLKEKQEQGPKDRWIVAFDFLLAAPAVKSMPNVLLCSPLGYISEAKRRILMTRHPQPSTTNSRGSASTFATLQETRLPSNGSLREQDYTFFWQGKETDEPRPYGVGFAVRNSLLSAVDSPSSGTAWILSFCLLISSGSVNFLSIYAPTLCSLAENKDEFYAMRRLNPPSDRSLPQNICTHSWTLMPGWELIMSPGPAA